MAAILFFREHGHTGALRVGTAKEMKVASSEAVRPIDDDVNDLPTDDAGEANNIKALRAKVAEVAEAREASAERVDTADAAAGDDPAVDEVAPTPPEADAAAVLAASEGATGSARSRTGLVTSVLVWAGFALAAGAAALALMSSGGSGAAWILIAAIGLAAVFFVGGATRVFSPLILTSALLRQNSAGRGGLAGVEMLSAMNLSDKVLDTDEHARLIARRDGVVIFANAAYRALAEAAGVAGPAGLPPRIDRLFAPQDADATKIFRLCRAAKSGEARDETIHQMIGLASGERRRFCLSVRPIAGAEDYVAWRIEELSLEDDRHDPLATAYADFSEPVFALEQTGQIAWSNVALRDRLGLARGDLRHLDDLVLGDGEALVKKLWQASPDAPLTAQIRQRFGDPLEATFKAFGRGGLGEGYVCIYLAPEEIDEAEEDVSVSGEMTDAPFGVAVIEGEFNRDAKVVEANKAFADVFSVRQKNASLAKCLPAETIDHLSTEIKRKTSAPRAVEAVVGGDGVKDAASQYFAIFARPVRRRRGSYGKRRTLLYSVEITDRKRMEEDYTQDQKLKAIGHLAGGVAHDFNNLLQVILGNCEHLMLRHPAGDPAYQELVLIRENAQRAANMTKQLLAYSRKQTLTRKIQSITDILLDFSRFLDRAVGEKVKLDLVNGRGLPPIQVDRNQLETAIMNLAVNARDAMAPDGGALTIATRVVDAAEIEKLGVAGLDDVDHVEIAVSDTGPGVPADIVDKIFDPFFTTKDEGKGTGLGLSTVHGVIGQLGGAITLESKKGEGATFRIFLPAATGEIETAEDAAQDAPPPSATDFTGSGRILVVEDEDPVRAIVVATLERSGYDVTAVCDGVDALELLEEGGDDFDLVLSDVMMPEIDGPSLIEKARAEHQLSAGVIFMSGYAETTVREQLDKIGDAGYIQKPFPMASLAAKVKESLAARAPAH